MVALLQLATASAAAAAAAASATGVASTTKAPATTIPRPYYCGTPQPIPPLQLNSSTQATLRQVQIVVRHGDRTPAFDLRANPCWANDQALWQCNLTQMQHTSVHPTDTVVDAPTRLYRKQYIKGAEVLAGGNCGSGQLTTVGHAQHLQNGAYVRDAYVSRQPLLPASWLDDPDTFHLRSDDAERTQESGQALFSGLYPADTDQLASVKLVPGQVPVVPFHVEDETTDTMTFNTKRCPALAELSARIVNSSAFTAHMQKVTLPLAARAAKAFGVPVPLGWTDGGMNTKLDCLMTHRCHNMPMPASLTEDLFDAIVAEDTWQFNFHLSWPGFAELAVGTFVGELWQNMQAVMNEDAGTVPEPELEQAPMSIDARPPPTARRFWLYAGHDQGPQMPLLQALGVYDGVWTPYASLVSLELMNLTVAGQGQGYAVRMIYQGKVMQMKGCSGVLCPIQEFEALVTSLVPTAAQCASLAPDAEADEAGSQGQLQGGLWAMLHADHVSAAAIASAAADAMARLGPQ